MMKNVGVSDCIVCGKHQDTVDLWGGVIYENDLIFISHAQLGGEENDHYLGHLFIEPKRHIPGLAELTEREASSIGVFTARVAKALKSTEDVDHVYSFVFGHHVPHLHIHLIGRYPDAPKEYWGTKVDEWPDGPRGKEVEINALSDRIRGFLKEYYSL